MLPGVLLRNKSLNFVCKDTYIKIENSSTRFTQLYNQDAVIKIPIAHAEGNYYLTKKELSTIKKRNQIIFSYCDELGISSETANPNGSILNIAGLSNEEGNVLGLMPHPERVSEKILGSTDGINLFKSIVNFLN